VFFEFPLAAAFKTAFFFLLPLVLSNLDAEQFFSFLPLKDLFGSSSSLFFPRRKIRVLFFLGAMQIHFSFPCSGHLVYALLFIRLPAVLCLSSRFFASRAIGFLELRQLRCFSSVFFFELDLTGLVPFFFGLFVFFLRPNFFPAISFLISLWPGGDRFSVFCWPT